MTRTREENAADLAYEGGVVITFTTRDIGALVKDSLTLLEPPEGISQVDSDVGPTGVDVDFIEDTDLNNLKLYISNGQVFTIRIIAGDR